MDDNNIFSKNLDLSDSEYSGGSDSDMREKQKLEEQKLEEQNGLVPEFRDDKVKETETETSGLITPIKQVPIKQVPIKPSVVIKPQSPTPSPRGHYHGYMPLSSSEMIDKPKNKAKQKIINAKVEKNIIAANEKEAKKKERFINRKIENFTKGKDSITNSLRSSIASTEYSKKKKIREKKKEQRKLK